MQRENTKKILRKINIYIYIYISKKNISEHPRNCQRLVEKDQNPIFKNP